MVADRIYIGDTGAFHFDNRARDVNLFFLKQTYKSLLSISETTSLLSLDIFCRAGSAQQAQQSTHLAESLNKL